MIYLLMKFLTLLPVDIQFASSCPISSLSSLPKQSFRSHSFLRIFCYTASGFHFPTWQTRPLYYVSQWQSGTVIPTDTGFLLPSFLKLSRLWWGYSTPPPHGVFYYSIFYNSTLFYILYYIPYSIYIYYMLQDFRTCLFNHQFYYILPSSKKSAMYLIGNQLSVRFIMEGI